MILNGEYMQNAAEGIDQSLVISLLNPSIVGDYELVIRDAEFPFCELS